MTDRAMDRGTAPAKPWEGHTALPIVAEDGAARGAWLQGSDGQWIALACGPDDKTAKANAALIVEATRRFGLFDEMVEALEWYADPISYAITQAREPRSAVHGDAGRRARTLLAKARALKDSSHVG